MFGHKWQVPAMVFTGPIISLNQKRNTISSMRLNIFKISYIPVTDDISTARMRIQELQSFSFIFFLCLDHRFATEPYQIHGVALSVVFNELYRITNLCPVTDAVKRH